MAYRSGSDCNCLAAELQSQCVLMSDSCHLQCIRCCFWWPIRGEWGSRRGACLCLSVTLFETLLCCCVRPLAAGRPLAPSRGTHHNAHPSSERSGPCTALGRTQSIACWCAGTTVCRTQTSPHTNTLSPVRATAHATAPLYSTTLDNHCSRPTVCNNSCIMHARTLLLISPAPTTHTQRLPCLVPNVAAAVVQARVHTQVLLAHAVHRAQP